MRRRLVLGALIWTTVGTPQRGEANPFPLEADVPKVAPDFFRVRAGTPGIPLTAAALAADAREVLRVTVDWHEQGERYELAALSHELSGTETVLARAPQGDALGSYRATLTDAATGAVVGHDTIGTGKEYRLLTRALSFRFPWPTAPADLVVEAENPVTGRMEVVLTSRIEPPSVRSAKGNAAVEVRLLRAATSSEKLILNVYAEGYAESGRQRFFQDAARLPGVLAGAHPDFARLEIRAVFASSAVALGSARDLGLPVPERQSFLGLYFPYWHAFGRWYHVVYPTREERYRQALAAAPYDYALALLDDAAYWGVGNFRELTAVPARSSSFAYLLLHELGHFFGLNEEYETGGPTELAFAPEIEEPWSQNVTFLRDPAALKWRAHVAASTPVPTPASRWRTNGPYGAYKGGYAETPPHNLSHKPGLACIMGSGSQFCPICAAAIAERIHFDLGTRGANRRSAAQLVP